MFTSVERKWLFILSLTINFFVLFILLQLSLFDITFSLVPGWHKITLPIDITVLVFISLSLFALGFAYIVIKLIYFLLTQLIGKKN